MDAANPPTPDALPPHEILDEIGRDTQVYRAREVSSGRIVALHLFMPGVLRPEQVGAFLAEARAAAQVQHPQVLPVLAAGLLEGQPCYTTALAVNGSLSERRDRFSDPRDAAALVERLAGATAAAHAHGLLHGGLKPGKILFDESDQPLVGGFGLTLFFRALHQEAALIGRSPLSGARTTHRPSPTLSMRPRMFGLWEPSSTSLLTGRPPFQERNAIDDAAGPQAVSHSAAPPATRAGPRTGNPRPLLSGEASRRPLPVGPRPGGGPGALAARPTDYRARRRR